MAVLRSSASYADASLSIKICAQRKAGRKKKATSPLLFFFLPFHSPLVLGTTPSRFALASIRNKKSEEKAARPWKWRIISLEFLYLLLRRYFGCFLRLSKCPKITFSSSFQPLQGYHELRIKNWVLMTSETFKFGEMLQNIRHLPAT